MVRFVEVFTPNKVPTIAWMEIASAVQRWAPVLYAIWAFPFLIAMALIMPPNGNADELEHFVYAARIADGHFVGVKVNGVAGSVVDPAAVIVMAPFHERLNHPEAKTTSAKLETSGSARWSSARAFFPTAATYPPFLYAPQVAAVLMGRVFNRSTLQTLYMVRIFNLVAALIVTVTALSLARRTRIAMLAIATLPMTMSLYSSTNHDALVIACTMVSVAILDRVVFEGRAASLVETVIASALIGMVAMSKPPYVALAGLLLLSGPIRSPRTAVATVSAAIPCVLWWWFASSLSTSIRPNVDAAAQLSLLLHEPGRILSVAHQTLVLSPGYLRQFIGGIGWLNVSLPVPFEILVIFATLAAWMTASITTLKTHIIAGLAAVAGASAVFGLLYLVASPTGASAVETVQGRYFLPIAVVGTFALPYFGRLRQYALCLSCAGLAVEMLLGPAVVLRSIVMRYYWA